LICQFLPNNARKLLFLALFSVFSQFSLDPAANWKNLAAAATFSQRKPCPAGLEMKLVNEARAPASHHHRSLQRAFYVMKSGFG
jgi:hypothetical protein